MKVRMGWGLVEERSETLSLDLLSLISLIWIQQEFNYNPPFLLFDSIIETNVRLVRELKCNMNDYINEEL